MGADIQGAGESVIEIRGESQLRGAKIHLIGDRIEAGTYLLAGVITGGEVTVEGIDPKSFGVFLDILREMGVSVSATESSVSVRCSGRIKGVKVKTGPFPEFATDLQAPLMAALTIAEGTSSIEETIYEGRFGHASELARMGANVKVSERTVTIDGVKKLTGAPVDGLDIRAAASLVLAALAAEGRTELHEVHHLRRGYEHVEKKFGALGARVEP